MLDCLTAFRQRLLPFVLVPAVAMAAPEPASADKLVEFLFWDSVGNSAAQGVANWQRLQAERSLWKNEASRLRAALERCKGCAEEGQLRAELGKWEGTERAYQDIAGQVFAMTGTDPLVQRLFGVENPAGFSTGRRQRQNYVDLPNPDWLLTSPQLCQSVWPQLKRCLQARQDTPGSNPRMCREPQRIVDHCGKGEFTEAQDYADLLALRSAGLAIPEVIDQLWYLTVDYGDVQEGFAPTIPTGAEMFAYLEENPDRREISFMMEPERPWRLKEARYGHFLALDYRDFESACPSYAGAPTDFPDLCKEIRGYSYGDKRYHTLTCDYRNDSRGGNIQRHRFWLHQRPEFAERARPISAEIANMQVVEFCPVDERLARAMAQGLPADDARVRQADYTSDMAAAGIGREGDLDITPGDAVARARELLDRIEEEDLTLASLDQAEAQPDAAQTDSAEPSKAEETPAPEPVEATEPDALKMDILGIRLGMPLAEAKALALAHLGGGAAVRRIEMLPQDRKTLFRNGMQLRGASGEEITLYSAGAQDDAPLVGISRVLEGAGPAEQLTEALLEKYGNWAATLNYSSVIAGVDPDPPCRATWTNIPRGMGIENARVETLVQPAEPLPRGAFSKMIMPRVVWGLGIEAQLEKCEEALAVDLRDRDGTAEMLASLVDLGQAMAYLKESAQETDVKLPDL